MYSSSGLGKADNALVTFEDFEHLYHLVEKKDGGPRWKHMMDRSTHDMSFQSWQREPEVTKTMFEDPFSNQCTLFVVFVNSAYAY